MYVGIWAKSTRNPPGIHPEWCTKPCAIVVSVYSGCHNPVLSDSPPRIHATRKNARVIWRLFCDTSSRLCWPFLHMLFLFPGQSSISAVGSSKVMYRMRCGGTRCAKVMYGMRFGGTRCACELWPGNRKNMCNKGQHNCEDVSQKRRQITPAFFLVAWIPGGLSDKTGVVAPRIHTHDNSV